MEPSAKRQKLAVMRVGDETLCHMDLEPKELYEEVAGKDFSDDFWNDEIRNDENEYDEDDCSGASSTSSVCQPYSEAQPDIHGEQLAAIDLEADKIEIERLQQMGVIAMVEKYIGELDIPLSAKMVRIWRKKQRDEKDENGQVVSTTAWLRRSRLVGRDFYFLEYREDVYSPASCSAVVKVLPSMAVTHASWTLLTHSFKCHSLCLARFLWMVVNTSF